MLTEPVAVTLSAIEALEALDVPYTTGASSTASTGATRPRWGGWGRNWPPVARRCPLARECLRARG